MPTDHAIIPQFISWYEKRGKDAWKVCGSLEDFILHLINYYKSSREFVITWPIEPDSVLHDYMQNFEVRCTLGDVHSAVQLRGIEFPIRKEYREYIERSLKMNCVQEIVNNGNTTYTATNR